MLSAECGELLFFFFFFAEAAEQHGASEEEVEDGSGAGHNTGPHRCDRHPPVMLLLLTKRSIFKQLLNPVHISKEPCR